MKKSYILVLIVISIIFIIVGCKNENNNVENKSNNVEKQKDEYLDYVQKLKKVDKDSEDLPFSIEIQYDKVDDEVRYQVIIDNPVQDIKNIKALAIHNMHTDDIFPSIGIFDDKVDLLKDKSPSGVILVGYIPYEGEIEDLNCQIKVLVEYEIDNNKNISYFVTK